jgi:hypothetical protein
MFKNVRKTIIIFYKLAASADAAATDADAVVIEEDGDEIDRFYDDIIGDGSAGTDSPQEFGDYIEEEGTDDEEEEEEEKDHYE